jgi:hypothetical protein
MKSPGKKQICGCQGLRAEENAQIANGYWSFWLMKMFWNWIVVVVA